MVPGPDRPLRWIACLTRQGDGDRRTRCVRNRAASRRAQGRGVMMGGTQQWGHGMPCPYGYRWPECHKERERAGRLAPSRLLLDFGPGGRAPTCSLLCWLAADDDGVALVVAGVDI